MKNNISKLYLSVTDLCGLLSNTQPLDVCSKNYIQSVKSVHYVYVLPFRKT